MSLKYFLKHLNNSLLNADYPFMPDVEKKQMLKETSKEEGQGLDYCPVTYLPITRKPEWTDLRFGGSYCATFSLIGEYILHVKVSGATEENSTKNSLMKREEIVREMGLWGRPYAEIRDYSDFVSLTRESRLVMIRFLLRERDSGNLLGFWVYSAPPVMRWAFNVGLRLYGTKGITFLSVDNYKTAIKGAIDAIDRANLKNSIAESRRFSRDNWKFESSDYKISFEIIGEDIVYSCTKGTVDSEFLEKYFEIFSNVLIDKKLTTRRYYFLVLDFDDQEKWNKKFIKAFNGCLDIVNEQASCRLAVKIVKDRGSVFHNILKRFGIGRNVSVVKNFVTAIEIIEKKRKKIIKKGIKKSGINDKKFEKSNTVKIISEQDINDFLEFIGDTNWDVDVASSSIVDQGHPFRSLYDAIMLVKDDFDVTLKNRKVAEERFKVMFESTHELISIHKISGETMWANRNWKEALGYSADNSTIHGENVHPDDLSKFKEGWGQLVHSGKKVENLEYRYKNAWGNYVLLNSTMKNLDTTSEKFCFIISQDITTIRANAIEKEEMQKQVFQSTKMASIGELAAGVAHEINNPLAIIDGHIDHLEKMINHGEIDSSEFKSSMKKQRRSISRIKNIVDGLRIYSRGDDQQVEVIDIHRLINDSVDIVRIIYEKAHIDIEFDYKSTNPHVLGNVGRFQQVLMNLMGNAKDAMKGTGGKIKIETENVGGQFIVIISDTGHGIKEDDLSKIFGTFFTNKPAGEGTGLGLSITQSIVNEMKGKIKVHSKVGLGTSFTITLPSTEMVVEISEQEFVRTTETLSGKVLVIDDEKDIREILEYYLLDFGLDVEMATDGIDGFEKISKVDLNYYSFVITDLQMPRMNGDVLVSKIKEVGLTSAKVFVTTGGIATQYSEEQKNRLKNADGYINKPFSQDEIFRVLWGKQEFDKAS